MFLVEFAVEMRHPTLDELVQLVHPVLRYAEPILRSHLLLAVGHERRGLGYRLVGRLAHPEPQVERRILAGPGRTRYEFWNEI